VRDFTRQERRWVGTASELLKQLPKPDPAAKGWPPNATQVGHLLSRYAPALRQQGIEFDRGKSGQRLITLSRSSQIKRGVSASPASDDREQPA